MSLLKQFSASEINVGSRLPDHNSEFRLKFYKHSIELQCLYVYGTERSRTSHVAPVLFLLSVTVLSHVLLLLPTQTSGSDSIYYICYTLHRSLSQRNIFYLTVWQTWGQPNSKLHHKRRPLLQRNDVRSYVCTIPVLPLTKYYFPPVR